MAEPCVSVIMPAHNNAPYIGLAIESVLNQSHKNWELLIVDDASSDGTLEAAEAHQAEDSRIKVFDKDKRMSTAARSIVSVGVVWSETTSVAFL